MKARYEYSCRECGGEVVKYRPVGEVIATKPEPVISGLHGWSCKLHGKGVAVKRTMKGK